MASEALPVIKDKFDIESAQKLVRLGYPAVAPRLGHMLEWIQDLNWPVAHVLFYFLAGIGNPLVPHLKSIFDGEDDVWKFWCLNLVAAMNESVIQELRQNLERMAYSPTEGEMAEDVPTKAREILNAK